MTSPRKKGTQPGNKTSSVEPTWVFQVKLIRFYEDIYLVNHLLLRLELGSKHRTERGGTTSEESSLARQGCCGYDLHQEQAHLREKLIKLFQNFNVGGQSKF